MEIVDYEVFEVSPRFQFLKLETSDGRVGWGEPVVEGRAHTVRAAIEELAEGVLLGADPFPIERHWQRMYRGGFYRGGPVLMSAIAGIDQALWDLKGKHFGAPVYELLGGKARDRVRLYSHVPAEDESPSAYAQGAASMVENGFTALKTSLNGPIRRVDAPDAIERERNRLIAIRDAVGPDIDLGIDFHGKVSKPMAKRLVVALEDVDPMFYEEPVLAEHDDALATVARHTSVPIATGERMFSRWDFKGVLESGTVDIVQPDLSHAGGITEVHKIAAMAEAYDVALAPHCPLGPVSLAACLQIDACSPNALVQEQVVHRAVDAHVLSYVENPEVLEYDFGGYVDLPDGPGLGVEIDEEALRAADGEYEWSVPSHRHDDGSVAEW
ncbi:galactonate dehydratase [Halobacteria archaeon AArc-m2/3/4]|uniref:Galactonate dehydratase n=1 Tax=Natronoglomus mannanivorans TaxID=2979990 RepID=A0ABT2QKK4_9EURY|nr:galactonate dehydratase [Halobacteria archaeon AArc-m2/3/4]